MHRRFHLRSLLALAAVFLLACFATRAAAQIGSLGGSAVPLTEPKFELLDDASRAHLERVDQFLADGQQEEAVDILRRTMEADGDKLIRVRELKEDGKTPFVRYYPARKQVQLRLARLASTSPETLALYRSRVDRIAERMLERAKTERDPQLIERVSSEFFNSSVGDQALWQLGESHLGRGEYAAARECWEALSPLTRTPCKVWGLVPERPIPPGRPLWLPLRGLNLDTHWAKIEPAITQPGENLIWLAYPDTDIPLADIRARIALVSIMEGNRERAKIEIDLVRRLHPDATGKIGGREGKYVELLVALLEQSARWNNAEGARDWPTFGGNSQRNRQVGQSLVPGAKELWHLDLPAITSDGDLIGKSRPRVAEHHRDGLLSYHPVVWKDFVFVVEHTQIRALQLATGQPAWSGSAKEGVIYRFGGERPDEEESEYPTTASHPRGDYLGVARLTATIQNDKLFARMGSRITVSRKLNPADREKQGVIVGLDLAAQGRMLPGFPLRVDGPEWNFEGTPVTDGVSLYVGLRKSDQVNSQAHVACYDVATGEMRWRRWVCSAATPGRGKLDELSHGLLTLVDGELYYNTNLGAVAKLHGQSGTIAWAMQYPRGEFPNPNPDRRDRHFFRDLTPCVYYQGMVIAAPSDYAGIFALDAATGQLVWTTPHEIGADAVHLLGAHADRLVASGDYLYWFDAFTGQPTGQFPPPQKDAPGFALPSPTGVGRGVLADGQVYWPTSQAILKFPQVIPLSQRGYVPLPTEEIKLNERGARGGNLIPVADKLIVVGAKQLQVFENAPPPSPRPAPSGRGS